MTYDDKMDAARDEARKESEALTIDQAESMTEYHPKVVAFLKRYPGAVYYGAFRYWEQDAADLVELKSRIPKSHERNILDSWPENPATWFVCSRPLGVAARNALIPDTPYPPMEGAA